MPDASDSTVKTTYRYRPNVLEALWYYGVQPKDTTRPALVHEYVSDLYRFEIRRLRARLLKNEFARREYAGKVVELRLRYKVISLRPQEWVE